MWACRGRFITVPQRFVSEEVCCIGTLWIRKVTGGLKSLPYRRPAVIGRWMRDPNRSWSRPRRAGDEQGSTGALHLIGSDPSPLRKKRPTANAVRRILVGMNLMYIVALACCDYSTEKLCNCKILWDCSLPKVAILRLN